MGRVASAVGVDTAALLAEYCARDLDFETDRADVHNVLADCVQRLGGATYDEPLRARVDAWYVAAASPNAAMFSALRAMRGRGKTLVLANNEAAHWDRLKDASFGHFGLFDVLASSWRVGADKPSALYFARLDRLLYPYARADCHLLDDNPAVIARARDEGLAATLFDGGGPEGQHR
jgi:putative hydrolase of the HAD superfamily